MNKNTNTPKYTIEEILANFDKTGKMPRAILNAFIVGGYYLYLNIQLLSESDAKRIQQLDRDFAYYDTEKNYTNYTYTFSIDKREFEVIAGRDVNYYWHFGDNDEDDVEVHEIDVSSDEPKFTIDEILDNFNETNTMPREFLDTFVVHHSSVRKDDEDRKLLSESDIERIGDVGCELTGEDTENNCTDYIYTFGIDKRKFEVEVSVDAYSHTHIGCNDDKDDVHVYCGIGDKEPYYTIRQILANFDKTGKMPREILETFVVCEDYDEDLLSERDSDRITQLDCDITDHDTEKNYTDYLYTFSIDKRKFEVSVGRDANYDSHFECDDEDNVEVYEVTRDKNSVSITLTKDQVKVLLECCKDPGITKLLEDAISDDSDDEDDCEDDDEWDEEEDDE